MRAFECYGGFACNCPECLSEPEPEPECDDPECTCHHGTDLEPSHGGAQCES